MVVLILCFCWPSISICELCLLKSDVFIRTMHTFILIQVIVNVRGCFPLQKNVFSPPPRKITIHYGGFLIATIGFFCINPVAGNNRLWLQVMN